MTYPLLQIMVLLVGGTVGFVSSGRPRGILVGCFLGWAFVMIGDRIALEFIPLRGALPLPVFVYITIAAGSALVAGLTMRQNARTPRTTPSSDANAPKNCVVKR